MINQRIKDLRSLMKKEEIDMYIIPSSDFHQSEYVGEYFECRQFMSGFTGSSGTLLVTQEESILWTDGRYFIQAEEELKYSEIQLYKMGEENVPTMKEYFDVNLKNDMCVGFDGRVISKSEITTCINNITRIFLKGIEIKYDLDLVGEIWTDRKSLPKAKAFLHKLEYTGQDFSRKLARLRKAMEEKYTNTHIMTSLDDIAWLFNIRGGDIKNNPVLLAYAIVTMEEVYLFTDKEKLNDEIYNELKEENVKVLAYEYIYQFVKTLSGENTILLDPNKVNYRIYESISDESKIVQGTNPVLLFKAIKNNIELKNIRNSHIKDGVAFTKFMYWLKTNIGKIEITEMSASEKLESLRREQDHFIEPSFDSISAYKEHGAIMHYRASEDTNYKLEEKDLYLIDSGGQYIDGTTDITRTIGLGEVKDEQRKDFTNVVRGMIRLSMVKFLHGCTGHNLDILARGPMWDLGIDYKSGTGHGIGYVLNVHEAPNGFRWRVVPERNDSSILEEGMVTTNEPGIYVKDSHGIRIENTLVTRKCEKNDYGQFMNFETITFAPIDLDVIEKDLMLSNEIEFLNKYHKEVFEKISPFLNEEETAWLKHYTREI